MSRGPFRRELSPLGIVADPKGYLKKLISKDSVGITTLSKALAGGTATAVASLAKIAEDREELVGAISDYISAIMDAFLRSHMLTDKSRETIKTFLPEDGPMPPSLAQQLFVQASEIYEELLAEIRKNSDIDIEKSLMEYLKKNK